MFETINEARERIASSVVHAERVGALGGDPRKLGLNPKRYYALADACEALAETARPARIATVYLRSHDDARKSSRKSSKRKRVVSSKRAREGAEHARTSDYVNVTCERRLPMSQTYVVDAYVVGYDRETRSDIVHVVEACPVWIGAVTPSLRRIDVQGGERDRPGWHSLGDDAVIVYGAPIVATNETTRETIKRVRDTRRATEHVCDMTTLERAEVMRHARAHGHASGSLRYAADALVHARFAGDELSCAVFTAVLRAGTWGILAPKPAHEVTARRREAPPCRALAEHVHDALRSFASQCPAHVIIDHVRRHLRDFDV